MAYDNYQFLAKYSWVQDKFGVSWQVVAGHAVGSRYVLRSNGILRFAIVALRMTKKADVPGVYAVV